MHSAVMRDVQTLGLGNRRTGLASSIETGQNLDLIAKEWESTLQARMDRLGDKGILPFPKFPDLREVLMSNGSQTARERA